MPTYCRMVESGYGSWAEVIELDARVVLQSGYYQSFKSDYESAYMELNKRGDS